MPTFPTLSTGATVQLGYAAKRAYRTIQTNSPASRHIAAYTRTMPLYSATLTYQNLTDAEAETLENFFISQGGRYASFTFPDPVTGTVYNNAYFDMDALEIRSEAKNKNSITIQLYAFS